MPDIYFKVSIHGPEVELAEIDITNLGDRLMDVALDAFPNAEVTVTTLPK